MAAAAKKGFDVVKAGRNSYHIYRNGQRLTGEAERNAAKEILEEAGNRVAPNSAIVDFAESSGRLGGRLWGADRIPTLTKYLEKRGVQVHTNQDDLLKQLAKQRGLNGADAAFLVRKDGRLQFLLSSNPTRREVLHELGHFLHRQKVGASIYDDLTTAQKEVSVHHGLSWVEI
jgi:hypothetical protein